MVKRSSPELDRVFHALADATRRRILAGGEYLIEMFNEEGQNHKAHGTYLEIVPPERLVFTWASEGFATDSKVTIELFERGEWTELVLTHELPEDMIEPHRQGWTNCLVHLEAFLN